MILTSSADRALIHGNLQLVGLSCSGGLRLKKASESKEEDLASSFWTLTECRNGNVSQRMGWGRRGLKDDPVPAMFPTGAACQRGT